MGSTPEPTATTDGPLERELGGDVAFTDDHERAVVNLLFTVNTLVERTNAALRPFSITEQHYNVLKIVERHDPDPIAVGRIKERMLNKKADLTRLLDKLERLGHLNRRPDPGNRRRIEVALTDGGRLRLPELDDVMARCRPSRDQLTATEARQLSRLLDKLRG